MGPQLEPDSYDLATPTHGQVKACRNLYPGALDDELKAPHAQNQPRVVFSAQSDPAVGPYDGEEMLWKGIADALTTRALTLTRSDSERVLALEWAGLAVKLYQRLANETRSEERRQSHVSSEMAVRCGLINLLPRSVTHPLLGPSRLEEWFLSTVGRNGSPSPNRFPGCVWRGV
jgi:hypothetical protein